jgi:hypothetical protein
MKIRDCAQGDKVLVRSGIAERDRERLELAGDVPVEVSARLAGGVILNVLEEFTLEPATFSPYPDGMQRYGMLIADLDGDVVEVLEPTMYPRGRRGDVGGRGADIVDPFQRRATGNLIE